MRSSKFGSISRRSLLRIQKNSNENTDPNEQPIFVIYNSEKNNEICFESIKNFQFYFPHNNIDAVLSLNKSLKKNKFNYFQSNVGKKIRIIFQFKRVVNKLLNMKNFFKKKKKTLKINRNSKVLYNISSKKKKNRKNKFSNHLTFSFK